MCIEKKKKRERDVYDQTYRFDDVRPLEETVLAPVPERQVAPPVSDQEVVVEGMEGRPRQILLHRLRDMIKLMRLVQRVPRESLKG